ncbi:uncharacterized protein [Montipora foliosa]|uniref:uncharacterized protein n=1 Tax=Montipora foliosa TaxID=591990 RepID=UPI0035F10568
MYAYNTDRSTTTNKKRTYRGDQREFCEYKRQNHIFDRCSEKSLCLLALIVKPQLQTPRRDPFEITIYISRSQTHRSAAWLISDSKHNAQAMALSKRLIILLSIMLWPFLCWASELRICFQETERSSQCQGPSHTCSGWSSKPAWSSPFRDDTDSRAGGCRYQWRIEANGAIDPNLGYRLCFRETEGSSQCQGTRESCTGWTFFPDWTKHFRDDTDNRSGGCKYAWKIESRRINQISKEVCRVCFKETEGSSQCQGSRESCSGWSALGMNIPNPDWTSPFRDDTDNRSGGCSYSWFLDCTSRNRAIFCPRNKPCS